MFGGCGAVEARRSAHSFSILRVKKNLFRVLDVETSMLSTVFGSMGRLPVKRKRARGSEGIASNMGSASSKSMPETREHKKLHKKCQNVFSSFETSTVSSCPRFLLNKRPNDQTIK